MILLIWHEIPENCKLFLVPLDHEHADLVRKSAGGYVNGSETADDHPVHALGDLIYGKDGKGPEWDLVPSDNTTPRILLVGSVTEIVTAGFVL